MCGTADALSGDGCNNQRWGDGLGLTATKAFLAALHTSQIRKQKRIAEAKLQVDIPNSDSSDLEGWAENFADNLSMTGYQGRSLKLSNYHCECPKVSSVSRLFFFYLA